MIGGDKVFGVILAYGSLEFFANPSPELRLLAPTRGEETPGYD